MAKQSLQGKLALVTGGATRVGRAISLALADAGCDILLHYHCSQASAESAAEQIHAKGRRAWLLQADLDDRDQLRRLADSVLELGHGSLDILVLSAANFDRVPPDSLDEASWDRALSLNATAPYLLAVALSDALRSARGCVVGIGCLSVLRPFKNYIPYSVSKAALVHLIKGLALSLAPHARANAILPGAVEPPVDHDAALVETLRMKAPLQRIGSADDVAQAVVFFAQNDFITGQAIAVDGGRSLV